MRTKEGRKQAEEERANRQPLGPVRSPPLSPLSSPPQRVSVLFCTCSLPVCCLRLLTATGLLLLLLLCAGIPFLETL
jgi:hypothetical protein